MCIRDRSNIKIYSANNIQELTTEGLLVKVYGVEDEPNFKDFNSYTDLIDKDKIPENSFSQISVLGDTILKTTTLGKAIIVTLPILIVFGLLIGLISLSIYIYKKLREKKKKKYTI